MDLHTCENKAVIVAVVVTLVILVTNRTTSKH